MARSVATKQSPNGFLLRLLRFARNDKMGRLLNFGQPVKSLLRLYRELHPRAGDFDLVIDLQGLYLSAFLGRILAPEGRNLFGFSRPREYVSFLYRGGSFCADWNSNSQQRYLACTAAALHRPVLPQTCSGQATDSLWLAWRPDSIARVEDFIEANDLATRRFVVLAPFSRWWTKNWPYEHWVELCEKSPALHFVVVGAAGDAAIHSWPKIDNLTTAFGLFTLPELAYLFVRAEMVVAVDSALGHLSAAVKQQTIALFGPTNPARTAPAGDTTNVLQTSLRCQPCYQRTCPIQKKCMTDISVTDVRDRINENLFPETHRAVFFDRDGTLNDDGGYVNHPDDFIFYPGIFEPLKRLVAAGFKLILITNQAGIGRGYFLEKQLREIHNHFLATSRANGVAWDAIYFAPAFEDAPERVSRLNLHWRKPAPGMLQAAARDHHIALRQSFFVGDRVSDLTAASRVGVAPILVLTGNGERTRTTKLPGLSFTPQIVPDISGAVDLILPEVCNGNTE